MKNGNKIIILKEEKEKIFKIYNNMNKKKNNEIEARMIFLEVQ